MARLSLASIAALSLAGGVLAGCATYYPAPPPPPPGWHGEGWQRHVNRCLRHYPRYNPRTDLVERPDGAFPCPL